MMKNSNKEQQNMNNWFSSGSPWIWLSAGGVSISLISVLGLLWLIASTWFILLLACRYLSSLK